MDDATTPTAPEQDSDLPPEASKLAACLAQGLSLPAAVTLLQLDPLQASSWVSSSEFARLLSSLSPDERTVRELFRAQAASSVEVIRELRDSAVDPKVRLAAAKDLLDRAGHTPIRKVATVTFTVPRERRDLVDATVLELED